MPKLPLPLLAIALFPSAATAAPAPVPRASVETRAARMFALADANRDGWLSRDEYARAVLAVARRYDPKVPADGTGMAQAMARFDALDTAHAGRLSRDTFMTAALAHFDGADLDHDGRVTPDEARRAAAIKQKALKAVPR